MRLRPGILLYAICILTIVTCLSWKLSTGVVFAQERKIDALFLELDKNIAFPINGRCFPLSLKDPYKRIKNGPPLTNVIDKAKVEWISRWIADPKKVVPNAKMPNLGLDFEEIKAVIAYLGSIKEKELPQVAWDAYLLKKKTTSLKTNTARWIRFSITERACGGVRVVRFAIR